MVRTVLTDAQWERWNRIALARRWMLAGSGGDTRLFLEAVLWTAQKGQLKIRPSANQEAAGRQKSSPRPTRWALSCALNSCRATGMTHSVLLP